MKIIKNKEYSQLTSAKYKSYLNQFKRHINR